MTRHRIASITVLAGLVCGGAAFAQNTQLVSVGSGGVAGNMADEPNYAGISSDGRYLAWASYATNFAPGDGSLWIDVFLRDRMNGAVEQISVDENGVQHPGTSYFGSLSADARYVAFSSGATLVASDANNFLDAYLRDRTLGTIELVSLASDGAQGNSWSDAACVTDDGRFVVFSSMASNLSPNDTNSQDDVFIRDRMLSRTERVSVSSAGVGGNAMSWGPRLSSNGRFVAFTSVATNLVANDTNNLPDVFLRDRTSGTTAMLSVDAGGAPGNSHSYFGAISADARYVAFTSFASNLVAGDTNGTSDAFVRDVTTGITELVSVDSSGVHGNLGTWARAMSRDARYVLLESAATNLVAGDANGLPDTFLRDRLTSQTILASLGNLGQQVNSSQAAARAVSDDGRYAIFVAALTIDPFDFATTLIPNSGERMYVRDLQSTSPVMLHYCTAKTNSSNCTPSIGASGVPELSGFDSFFLIALYELPNKSGLFFWGATPAATPFEGGTLCVQPPFVRTPVQNSGNMGGTCGGSYSFAFRQSYMTTHGVAAGQTLYGQYWSRDPGFAPPNDVGLTDGIQFTISH